MVLSMVAKISVELADGTCEVAFKARYIGRRDSGIPVSSAFSSLSNSCFARAWMLAGALVVVLTSLIKAAFLQNASTSAVSIDSPLG